MFSCRSGTVGSLLPFFFFLFLVEVRSEKGSKADVQRCVNCSQAGLQSRGAGEEEGMPCRDALCCAVSPELPILKLSFPSTQPLPGLCTPCAPPQLLWI